MKSTAMTKKVGCSTALLGIYEKECGLNINRNSKNHRMYSDSDLKTLKKIHKLRSEGCPYKDIRQILQEDCETKVLYLNADNCINVKPDQAIVVGVAQQRTHSSVEMNKLNVGTAIEESIKTINSYLKIVMDEIKALDDSINMQNNNHHKKTEQLKELIKSL